VACDLDFIVEVEGHWRS